MRRGRHGPAELLAAGNTRLISLQPALKCEMHFDGWPYRVRFDYPGQCLLVYDGPTGELLAKSRRGRPSVPAKLRGAGSGAAR